MSTPTTITYYYRGLIEKARATRRVTNNWRAGYSANTLNREDGQPLYPWNTRRECQQEAKSRGLKAVFIDIKSQRIA